MKESLLQAERVNLEEVRELARAGFHYIGSDTTGIVLPHLPARSPDHRRTSARIPQRRGGGGGGYRPCQYWPAGAEQASADREVADSVPE
jgi:hypothetical protein